MQNSEKILGTRVVRGPDWKWGNQDGGEGFVGTIVELGKIGSATSPDKTVVVQWDNGNRTNYRVGYQGAYDLRVWDNAPIGVRHHNIACNSCCHTLQGMRWKCKHCDDFDLCSTCYFNDKHDLNHSFFRFESASSNSTELDARTKMSKVEVKGIFPGAKVTRGVDWDWGNQDGGDGQIGHVLDIRGWDSESGRSVANVEWGSSSTNVYRLGHKGKVDLKLVHPAIGGSYYREALPIVASDTPNRSIRESELPRVTNILFSVGDKVKVVVIDSDRLREMQEGHGGWNPRMTECIGLVGIVHRVTERGDVRVQFDSINQRWTFHPRAIHRLPDFAIGDAVRLIDDAFQVKLLQQGHGEWVDVMISALGKIGRVIKIYDDGDLRVTVDGQTWTLNPLCVAPLPGSASELHNSMASSVHRQEHTKPLASLLTRLSLAGRPQQPTTLVSPDNCIAERLVRAAAQGEVHQVEQLLITHPDQVNAKHGGKTSLQVAAHQGHTRLVSLLLSIGASIEVFDDEGDRPLHYGVFGNQPEIVELFIKKGAEINCVNRGGCTPLHVAVNKQFHACVCILLKNGCDVNIQDSYGDTALHDAIGKENSDIVEVLTNAPTLDFTLRNKRGFNVLHHAALKGNCVAAERILVRSRQLVDVKKDDGFSAIHLASLNGHFDVAKLLITLGQCSVDPLNNRKQTPLLLAVSQGHEALVELLVAAGADVTVADEDGDTGIHVACLKINSVQGEASSTLSPHIANIQQLLHENGRNRNNSLGLAIACYLAELGCNPEARNRKNKTCADLCADASVWDSLMVYVQRRKEILKSSERSILIGESGKCEKSVANEDEKPTTPERSECLVCCEHAPDIVFEPCGHRIACFECAQRMKKCLECQELIACKTKADGTIVYSPPAEQNSNRLKYLESRIAEIEEAWCCSICMERRRNVAFLCGHGACDLCSQTLRTCHMCRKIIARKINLY